MEAKIFLWFVFLCFLHISSALPVDTTAVTKSPIQDAIENINPELQKLTEKIQNLKTDIHQRLLQLSIDFNEELYRSGSTILHAIKQLQDNLANISATVQPKNDICTQIAQTELHKILEDSDEAIEKNSKLLQTRIADARAKITGIFKEADGIETNMNKIIGYCIRQHSLAWHKDKLNNCLQDEVQLLHKVVGDLQTDLQLQANNIKCDETFVSDYKKVIQEIGDLQFSYTLCIHQHEKKTNNVKQESFSTVTLNKTEIRLKAIENKDGEPETIPEDAERTERIFMKVRNVQLMLNQLKELQIRKKEQEDYNYGKNKQNSFVNVLVNDEDKDSESEKEEKNEKVQKFILYIEL